MATPLINVWKNCHKCGHSLRYVCRRYFASKRKKSHKDEQKKKVQIKSLFSAQGNDGKASSSPSSGAGERQQTHKAMVDGRREQAARSVLVRVPVSPQAVCDSLQAVGPISQAFCLQGVKDYILVEFQHKDTVDRLMQHTSYFPDSSQIPVRSRLLYAMNTLHYQKHRPATSIETQFVTSDDQQQELSAEDYITADSLVSQMRALHASRQLSDVGSRVRFLVCSLVEDLVGGCLPFARVLPFGSSSNGFGWSGCDLDMMVSLQPPESHVNSTRRFRFLTKRGSDEGRVFGQQCLDVVGEMVRGLMPSAHSVTKVLNARVPIIKFRHQATGLDCDLSTLNMSGWKMSELMHVLGETDPRLRPLMTVVKQWARSCDLSRPHPGPWPSSFTLLSLVIAFLQQCSPPVLPPLARLQQLAGPDDHFIIDDIDYAFVTDVSRVPRSTNKQPLDELLKEFFHFYAHFDFSSQGLSLIEGCSFPRLMTTSSSTQTHPPASSPAALHIENPLDLSHNVGMNVSGPFLARLQASMVEALQCLEAKGAPAGDQPWGLLCLFMPQNYSPAAQAYSVTGLFEEEEEAEGHSDVGGSTSTSSSVVAEDSESLLAAQELRAGVSDGDQLSSGGVEKGSAVS